MRFVFLICMVLAWTILTSIFWPESANAIVTRFESAPRLPFPGMISEEPDLRKIAPSGCAPVDFRPGLAKNRSQGNTGFCFAYSTAALVNQRTGIDVSALDLATTFYFAHLDHLERHPDPVVGDFLKRNPRWRHEIEGARDDSDIDESTTSTGRTVKRPYFPLLAGGTEDVTLLLSNTVPLCPDRDFPSDQGVEAHSVQIQKFVRIAESSQGPAPAEIGHVYPKFRDPVADFFNFEWLRYRKQSCQRRPSRIPLLPVRYYAAETFEDYLNRIRRGEIDSRKEARELFHVLNFALDHQRSPAIGYSLFTFSPREPDDTDLYADHSSAVLARKRIGHQCHYLIRDNSGLDCDDFFPQYRKRCMNAELWVTEEELGASLYSVVYLR